MKPLPSNANHIATTTEAMQTPTVAPICKPLHQLLSAALKDSSSNRRLSLSFAPDDRGCLSMRSELKPCSFSTSVIRLRIPRDSHWRSPAPVEGLPKRIFSRMTVFTGAGEYIAVEARHRSPAPSSLRRRLGPVLGAAPDPLSCSSSMMLGQIQTRPIKVDLTPSLAARME